MLALQSSRAASTMDRTKWTSIFMEVCVDQVVRRSPPLRKVPGSIPSMVNGTLSKITKILFLIEDISELECWHLDLIRGDVGKFSHVSCGRTGKFSHVSSLKLRTLLSNIYYVRGWTRKNTGWKVHHEQIACWVRKVHYHEVQKTSLWKF